MGKKDGMEGIEARLFASYFQDGMWDIMIGWMMIVTALRSFVDHWMVSFLIFAGIILAYFVRKYVTMKRIGYAKFGTERRTKRKRLLFLVIGANLLTLLILIVTLLGFGSASNIFGFAIVVTILIIFSAVAYSFYYPRFFLWGVMFSGGILISEILGMDVGKYVFLLLGTVVTMIGIIYFMIFLKKYSKTTGA